MNKIALILSGLCITISISGQVTENEKLVAAGKAYKNFMFRNEPPRGFLKGLRADVSGNMKSAMDFIGQAITTGNDLLKPAYLTLPADQTLKFIYIARAINYNVRVEDQVDDDKLIDSLKTADISKNELVNAYYSMLFASVGNKDQPFDLSKIDFKLTDYNLANDTEKGMFFLRCMDYCGTEIWGYMNIVKPPNTSKAFSYIKKFPKFNGLKYYQFTDLNFPDFEMFIVNDKEKQSYKGYYINKYYELLLSHLACMNEEGANQKDINDFLLGSILKDRELYKYTTHKKELESMFKEQKTN